MTNQEPAYAWIFGNSSVRVGTQGLFCPYLKTFVSPFLPTRLTAPRSPRMTAHKKWAKSGSQAKSTGPLLQKHSLKLSQEVCADWLVCIFWHLIGSDNLSFFFSNWTDCLFLKWKSYQKLSKWIFNWTVLTSKNWMITLTLRNNSIKIINK